MNKQSIKSLVNKPDAFVLDVGCYDGKDSKELSDILKCDVHCFEPDPLSQDLFDSLHGTNKRLHLHRFALSNTNGEIDFYQSNHPQSNSIRQPKRHLNLFPAVEFDEVTKVKSKKLDTWYIQRSESQVIDFIWADLNGSEKDFILGGLTTLSVTRFLYIEAAVKELYEGQVHVDDLLAMIKNHLPYYEMVAMYNWGESFGNVLLKNNNL